MLYHIILYHIMLYHIISYSIDELIQACLAVMLSALGTRIVYAASQQSRQLSIFILLETFVMRNVF